MNAVVETQAQAPAVTQNQDLAMGAGLQVGSPLHAAMMAMKSGLSAAEIRDMLQVQREWEAGEARKAFVRDMAAFKRNPPDIVKDKLVSFQTRGEGETSYTHATIGNVVGKIAPALAEHGFSHSWSTVQENGRVIVTCVLTHRDGHSERVTLEGSPDSSGKKNGIQQVASTVTYLQRYTLLLATGLAARDQMDDDGAGSTDPIYDPEAELAKWTKAVNEAPTTEELQKARKEAGEAFKAAGDVDGWNTIKALAAGRAAELKVAA